MRSMTTGAAFAALAAGFVALPAAAQQVSWEQMPRMQLERQFAGPLRDTIIQRWRDAIDGTVCYIYLPITAAHTPPVRGGYVQYGANTIGSISCVLPQAPPPRAAGAPPRPRPQQATQDPRRGAPPSETEAKPPAADKRPSR